MFDLQVLAYQIDMTRVITMMIGREQSGMTYPQIGVPDSHHPISHHQGNAEKIANLSKINAYHVSCSPTCWRSSGQRPTATGRCSTT